MPHILFFAILILFASTILNRDIYAARGLTITSDKSSLFGDEEATIKTSQTGFTDGETIYVKGAFYQDGTRNYFGYTKGGDSWVRNGDPNIRQRQIKIGDWDGNLTVKSDFLDSGFIGEGDYKFKVGFYYLTSSGNLSSVNWSSNNLDFNINQPDPTPTPSPSIPTSSPAPPQSKSPTPQPSVQLVKSSSPLAKSPQILSEKTEASANSSSSPNPTPSPEGLTRDFTKEKLAPVLIGAGAFLILLSGAFYIWYRRVTRLDGENEIEGKDDES